MASSNISTIKLSIVIISYNTAKITKHCLDSIYKSISTPKQRDPATMVGMTKSTEIIVVDNASTDGSLNMLREYKKNLNNFILIESRENLGFARANNLGVGHAHGNYILFLNSDIIVLDDAIDKLFDKYTENSNKIHFLGGKLFNKNMTPQPSSGPFYSLPVIFAALFLKGDYYGLTRYSPNKIKEVDWVSGACILTKKEYFEKIGGFDEKIFMYMDEIDLLYRAKKSGFKVYFYPDARFIHLGSASSNGRTYPIIQVYNGFNYFYKKHHSAFSLKLLKFMLKLKAVISISIGKITKNNYLTETYEKAYKLV